METYSPSEVIQELDESLFKTQLTDDLDYKY